MVSFVFVKKKNTTMFSNIKLSFLMFIVCKILRYMDVLCSWAGDKKTEMNSHQILNTPEKTK